MRASYEVVRQLGEGGVGRVYEAIHHPSGRTVAIKTLRTEHGSPTSQRLLLNEAAAAAQVTHPAIVELIDVGRDDRGAMFLVMELVRGSSLEAWGMTFPGIETVFRAMGEILGALGAAHAQGIVHGDLKPGNVLLTADGRVKLTDFGIAHVIDPLRNPERRGVQGTPYYMAPEQLVDLESIGPSTDLYAIGVMLYELFSGKEPYSSEGTLGEVLARKIAPIAPLSPRKGLAISTALRDLVARLLEPDPRIRPRFAAEVRRELAQIAASIVEPSIRPPASGVAQSLSTWVDAPLGSEPTITSSSADEIPRSAASTRSLPFTLPCVAGATPEVALHRLRPLPLFGRSEQTARIAALALEVISGQGPRGLIVSGRAGEGKTRVLRHGFAEVERGGVMLGAAASFDENVANTNVGLRACVARLLGATLPSLEDTLETRWKWLTRVPQPDVDFAKIHEWLSPGRTVWDAKTSAGIAAMAVLAASRVCPVYLWLDDVAWSRDGAMELLVGLLEDKRARVLVVGSLRSGTAEHPAVRKWLLDAARVGAHFEMLPPLTTSERVALLEAAGSIAPDVATALALELDEPTLVLVEAVRAWIDEGLLVPSDRGLVLRDGARIDELVARARGSVLARRISYLLGGFGDDKAHAERVLCHAALLGLRLEESVLRSCGVAQIHVDRVLDRALLSGLLRVDRDGRSPSAIDGRGAYRFEHRLFLDVIVERLERRDDAHAIFCDTADALTKAYGKRNIETGLATAMLYRAGGAKESAIRRAADTARAFVAASHFDSADRAITLMTSWNEADRIPPGHLFDALLERTRGLRHYFALDYPRARGCFERARAAFEALGSTNDLHGVFFDISSTYFYEDRFAEADRWVSFVEGPMVNRLAHARGHHRRAEIASMRGDLVRAIEQQRRASAVIGDADAFFAMLSEATLAELLISNGDLALAATAVERGSAMAAQMLDRHSRTYFEHTLAALDAARGYFAAARARIVPRLADLLSRGDKWHTTSERALLMLCAVALDPPAESEAAVRAFIDAYTEVPHDEAFTWWSARATVARLRERKEDALADELSTLLDTRMARIARAFVDG
ncbi:MAG TPA: serine/threonine-protein kinase, partial [Polyangiaceae bacterium]|nr:serine/threonine-protein kinase [Polyangiaceae bacterium]